MLKSCTDIGNAVQFLRQHGDSLKWDLETRQWQLFNDKTGRWVITNKEYVMIKAIEFMAQLGTGEWARECQSIERINALIEIVKLLPYCVLGNCLPEECVLDTDPPSNGKVVALFK